MRVAQVRSFGPPEVLTGAREPDPVAGPGQVVVDVAVADVLFIDAQLRSGWGVDFFGQRPPYTPGTGVAGLVSSVGADVVPGWVGRRVITMVEGGRGGYAEKAVASADALVPVPDSLTLRDAAALLQVGPAGLSLFDAAELKRGEWVLVTAAGGGLGSLLVQLAHGAGARVIAAARGQVKLDLAKELGAEMAVDYSLPGWSDRVREATGGVDVVYDGVGGAIGGETYELTAEGGRFFAYGVPSGEFTEIEARDAERRAVTVRGIELVQFETDDARRLAGRALAEAVAGRIRPVIGQTFPLERAADAHAAIESRAAVGKTLLLI